MIFHYCTRLSNITITVGDKADIYQLTTFTKTCTMYITLTYNEVNDRSTKAIIHNSHNLVPTYIVFQKLLVFYVSCILLILKKVKYLFIFYFSPTDPCISA